MTDPDLHVTGGVGGVDAHYEDIEQLARQQEQLGAQLAGLAAECHAMLVHPDVVASAALNPHGVARFENSLLGALDGQQGLSTLALELGAQAVALRTAAASYRAVDEAQAQLLDAIRWAAGDLTGTAAPLLAMPTAAGLFGLYEAGEAAGVDWQRLLTDHPGVVDTLAGMSPGLVTGLPGPLLATDLPSATGLLAMLYPDSSAVVTEKGSDFDPSMTRPPSGFADLMDGLGYRNDIAEGAGQGQIDVRVVMRPDGSRAFIVDVPGTKDWQPAPLQHHDKLTDLGTNLHAMAGDGTAYQKGITDALRRVGADQGDPIMLVAHSQGGLVATRMAADLAGTGFNVTHVVTAGSPVGSVDVPDDVQVLSLENEHDIVPRLDGADNPDRANRVTVSFDSQNGDVKHNHGIQDAYRPAAAALDRSTDPSVVAYHDSASAFFGGDGATVTPHVYQITRG